MTGFVPKCDLEKSLYNALVVLMVRYDKTKDPKFQKELREVNEALVNYHNTKECAGGPDHDWGWVDACTGCLAPDEDCQNFHTIWCPTCLGCGEGE